MRALADTWTMAKRSLRHTTRSVDTLIKRIRRKIEPDPDQPRFILTVWGTGYKFADV